MWGHSEGPQKCTQRPWQALSQRHPSNPHSNPSSFQPFKVTRPPHLGIVPSCLPVPPVKMCSSATFMSAPAQTLDLTPTATRSVKCSDSQRNPPILDFHGTTGLHTPGTVVTAREPCALQQPIFKQATGTGLAVLTGDAPAPNPAHNKHAANIC